ACAVETMQDVLDPSRTTPRQLIYDACVMRPSEFRGAIEISSGVYHNSGEGSAAVVESGKTMNRRLLPSRSRRSDLIDDAASSSAIAARILGWKASRIGRPVEIACAIEDHTATGQAPIAEVNKAVERCYCPVAKHGVTSTGGRPKFVDRSATGKVVVGAAAAH